MKPFLVFLLIPLAMAGYYVAAIRFGLPQRYPVVAFVVMAAALFGLGYLLKDKFTWGRAVLNVAGWGLAALFAWWTLVYSTYRDGGGPLARGSSVPGAVVLTGAGGETVSLSEVVAQSPATLLVFYRGPW